MKTSKDTDGYDSLGSWANDVVRFSKGERPFNQGSAMAKVVNGLEGIGVSKEAAIAAIKLMDAETFAVVERGLKWCVGRS